jgi:sensor c-di-GMP phosphodiesterase-like protein
VSDFLRNADTTLYQVKGTKRRYEVFRPSMHTRTLKLEVDLRRTIEGGGFKLHYQPQVTFDTCTIAEMEALVRWDIRGAAS